MDINELIRISEEAERRRRMLGGVDAFDQIAKRQALFDAAERNLGRINGIDSYRLDQIARQNQLFEKTIGLGTTSYKDFINDRVLEAEKAIAQLSKINAIQSPIFDLAAEANRSVLGMLHETAFKDIAKEAASLTDFESLAGVRAKDWRVLKDLCKRVILVAAVRQSVFK